jgi:hypothetical protein
MLERDPGRYGKWAKGIDGSGRNPLSARALNRPGFAGDPNS